MDLGTVFLILMLVIIAIVLGVAITIGVRIRQAQCPEGPGRIQHRTRCSHPETAGGPRGIT